MSEEDEISSDGLEIDISESPNTETNIDIEDKRVLENIEEEIERQYDEKAAKSNLTAINVKNILKHVITNEHVWAMVRNTTEENVSEDEQCVYEPKLTRAKAKELLKEQNVTAIPWVKPNPSSEVHILINEELPEDSDDDEYVPQEEEQSEDEKENCNPSDFDSQPVTSATPAVTLDSSTQTVWSEDGVFKVPAPAKESRSKESENIARRTRSKLSLSDTPLEIIEEAFIPPDITTDMYDFECDDEDWREFLKKFTRPLDEAVHGPQEDDDEADPEYNILADEEIDSFDQEELRQDRAVKVTKRELNSLVSELFDFSEIFTEPEKTQQNDSLTQNVVTIENTVSPENVNNSENVTSVGNVTITENVITAENGTSTENIPSEKPPEETLEAEQIIVGKPSPKPEVRRPIMTESQQLLFEQQLRQHIQMLTQNFLLTYKHPYLSEMAENFKNMLLSFSELSKYNKKSAFNAATLQMSVDFITEWEKLIDSDTEEVKEMLDFVKWDYNRYKSSRENKTGRCVVSFPTLLMKKVSESPAFMYPSLLPKIPLRISFRVSRAEYTPSENALIALGLEQFLPYLEKSGKHKSKFGKVRRQDVASFICKYMMPHKPWKKIYQHFFIMNDKHAPPNPIKYCFTHKKAPATKHYVAPLSHFQILPPCKRQPQTLPYQWRVFLNMEKETSPPKKVLKPPAFNKGTKKRLLAPKGALPVTNNNLLIVNNDISNFDTRSQQVILVDKVAIPRVEYNKPVRGIKRVVKRKVLPKIEEVYIRDSPNNRQNFLPENVNDLASKSKNTVEPSKNTEKNLTEETRTKSAELSPRKRNIAPAVNGEEPENIFGYSPEVFANKPLFDSFKCAVNFKPENISSSLLSFKFNSSTFKKAKLKEFRFNSSIFRNLKGEEMLPSMPFLLTPVKDNSSLSESTQSELEPEIFRPERSASPEVVRSDESEILPDKGIVQQKSSKDDENEINALMIASSTIQQKNRRLQPNLTKKAKQIKEYNANLSMLCPEDYNVTEEKAKNFAQAYYDKVQERLQNEPSTEYQKFMEALSEHDESRSSVSDLYEKVSSVLSPNHSDLCEEFLTFLTPEQAKQIGKLVPHFMLSNMSLFLRKLEIYYNNQPAQLRRIYNSLTELANIPDITMDKVRSSILPLLKGNALLINWFLQMFPHEAPPESLMTDWEQMSCEDGNDLDDVERVFETITLPEVEDPYGGPNCICQCHKISDEMYANRARHCIPCGTKFLQGRIYVQTGKSLRLANVTFNYSPNTNHNKRLSVKPNVRQKRKSETSPSKLLMSPPKPDDEPRHSNNESEDDVNFDSNPVKKVKPFKPFRTNSPSKSRKKPKIKAPPKAAPKKETCRSKANTATSTAGCPRKIVKQKGKKTDDSTSNETSILGGQPEAGIQPELEPEPNLGHIEDRLREDRQSDNKNSQPGEVLEVEVVLERTEEGANPCQKVEEVKGEENRLKSPDEANNWLESKKSLVETNSRLETEENHQTGLELEQNQSRDNKDPEAMECQLINEDSRQETDELRLELEDSQPEEDEIHLEDAHFDEEDESEENQPDNEESQPEEEEVNHPEVEGNLIKNSENLTTNRINTEEFQPERTEQERDSLKMDTNESEPETTDWDQKGSPGHSVESMDTCEESSQDTLDAQVSESEDSITEEVESLSENSEDSSSQQEETGHEIVNTQTWTREEDKIILQTYQEHGDIPEVFNDIQRLLPDRTVSEIRQRFQTLMNLLQKMASDAQQD